MMDRISKFIGDVARPVAIIVSSVAASAASVIASLRIENGNDGAILLAAIFGGVGAMYGLKAVENWRASKNEADVKIAENSK